MKLQDMDVGQTKCINLEELAAREMSAELDTCNDIRTRIAATMGLIDRVQRTRYDAELDKVGLTAAQVQVLLYILKQSKSGEEITARQLEERFQVSNPTMSGILKRLEKKAFIERKPSRLDKRNKQILIRGEVVQLGSVIEKRVAEETERIFQDFSPEDLERLLQLVSRLLYNIKKVRCEEEE